MEKPLQVSSPLGTRVSVDMICRDYELEIFRILLTVDLRVMDMSDFDDILGMDWLTAQRVIIDCDRRRITAYTRDGVCVTFQGDKHDAFPQEVYDSRWHLQLMGWLVSLTEVKFLGHVALALGVSVDPEKVEAVMSWERSKSSRCLVSSDWQGTTRGSLRISPS